MESETNSSLKNYISDENFGLSQDKQSGYKSITKEYKNLNQIKNEQPSRRIKKTDSGQYYQKRLPRQDLSNKRKSRNHLSITDNNVNNQDSSNSKNNSKLTGFKDNGKLSNRSLESNAKYNKKFYSNDK